MYKQNMANQDDLLRNKQLAFQNFSLQIKCETTHLKIYLKLYLEIKFNLKIKKTYNFDIICKIK
jgi:hypothetical protein